MNNYINCFPDHLRQREDINFVHHFTNTLVAKELEDVVHPGACAVLFLKQTH